MLLGLFFLEKQKLMPYDIVMGEAGGGQSCSNDKNVVSEKVARRTNVLKGVT